MRALVLDLATVSGFAFGDDVGGLIAHGSHRIPPTGERLGLFLFHYATWLSAMLSRMQPEEVVYESPILTGLTNLTTLRKLYAMGPRTEEICDGLRIPTREANLTDIRMHFIGRARAPKGTPKGEGRAWLKSRTMAECRARGVRPADDNDADALALLSFVCSQRNPNFTFASQRPATVAA